MEEGAQRGWCKAGMSDPAHRLSTRMGNCGYETSIKSCCKGMLHFLIVLSECKVVALRKEVAVKV